MLSQSLWKWCTVCVQWTYRSIDDLNTPHTSQRNLLLGNSCVVGIAKMLHCFIFMKSFTKITLAGCVGVNASLAPFLFLDTINGNILLFSQYLWCDRIHSGLYDDSVYVPIPFDVKIILLIEFFFLPNTGPRKKKTELKLSTWKCFGCNVICKWRRNHFVLIEKNCR